MKFFQARHYLIYTEQSNSQPWAFNRSNTFWDFSHFCFILLAWKKLECAIVPCCSIEKLPSSMKIYFQQNIILFHRFWTPRTACSTFWKVWNKLNFTSKFAGIHKDEMLIKLWTESGMWSFKMCKQPTLYEHNN